jgi:hypothetical protein
MLKNKIRLTLSAVFSTLFVYYCFNFVPRNVAILATRTLERKILDYILNFAIFFVVFYLILELLAFIFKKRSKT